MNVSKLNNPYTFIGNNENLFKVQTYDCGLPSKISGLLKLDNGEFTVRFCNNWILCVGNGTMLIWKFSSNKKNSISSCIEYQIPYCASGHNARQVLIMNGTDIIIITNDGHVRYWPRLDMPSEYLDGHINGLSQDECLLTENLSDGAVVAVFKSMKIVTIDLRDSSESGISMKVFTQPRGFINGMGRYLSSFIVSSISNVNHFKNVKVNNLLPEETEILIMANNNIDTLSIDVLFNGQYKKEILQQDSLKKAIFDSLYKETGVDVSELNLVFENFDLCQNILYVLVQVQINHTSNYVLFTYNRKMSAIDTIAAVNVAIVGQVELTVLVDESADSDEPCLLVTLKDDHNLYIVEVLTGTVKSELNTERCLKTSNQSLFQKTIVGWTCPILSHDPDTIVVVLTASKHLIAIKQNINPLSNQSFANSRQRGDNTELDFNLSNASFHDWNTSKLSTVNPIALSTPITKSDQKGDRLTEPMNVSCNKTEALNGSLTTIGAVEKICPDTSSFGTFKKSVVLYWLGYKSQAKRVLGPIIERAQVNNDISLSLFVLEIVRDIIDEYPGKDPRWTAIVSGQDTKGFIYSNKSLLLAQQIQAKKESLQKLVLMLKENNVDLFGVLGSVAPMNVCQSLYMQRHRTMLTSFGCGQVAWSVTHCLCFGIEMLEFVRMFNEIIASENCDEINQILAKCCQHVLALQRKLTPIDIISQEISLIPRFIREIADYLKEKQFASLEAADMKCTLILLGKIISGCLKSSLISRREFEESFLYNNFDIDSYHPSIVAPCWITESQPIGVLDSVVDIINCLLDLSSSTDYHVFDSAVDIVALVLDCFRYRLTWMESFSGNMDELKRLDDVYATTRTQMIAKIVSLDGNLETALAIADKFADFHWLTSICEILDNQSGSRDSCHLEPYLQKWSNDGLSEFVLDWYQDRLKEIDQKSQGKLLAKIQLILEKIQKIEGTNVSARMDTSSSSQVIGKFLEKAEVQTTRWLHDIETGEFSQAALSLKRLAETEELSIARRKILLGLAKLSYLANTDLTTEETEHAVEKVNKYLELISFQEEIPSSVIESQLGLSAGASVQPVLGSSQIVKLYLASVHTTDGERSLRYFVKALALMDFAWYNRNIVQLSETDWTELLLTVWTQIVRYDDWSSVSIETSRQTSTFSKVYRAAVDRGLSMDIMRPDLDRLFETEKDNDKGYPADVEFLVRGTLESMVGDIDMDDDVADEMSCE